jgi:CheY-like chemotaxis protein
VDHPRNMGNRTGLGLYLCNKLVQRRLHGKLEIEGEQDAGTAVSFNAHFLPAWAGAGQEEAGQEAAGQEAGRPEGREQLEAKVLVVDDNQSTRTYLEGVLLSWQCSVKSVEDGVQALRELKMAQAKEADFDILLLDYHIPFTDALEVVTTIREDKAFSALLIILMICPSDSKHITALPSGVQRCIIKPIKKDSLLKCVKSLFEDRPLRSKLTWPRRFSQEKGLPLPNKLHILVAVDHVPTQHHIQRIIEAVGYTCTFPDCPQSLAIGHAVLAQCQLKRFDVIFMVRGPPMLSLFSSYPSFNLPPT